ncbi:hypothetical protein N566_28100 [Streptomycetaceae bacterium MP113-05]|nr:hypothetical protein N566_28100 [Streptomycetaceae bacterium MP113-05]
MLNDSADEYEIQPAPDRLPGLLLAPVDDPRVVKDRLYPDFRPDGQDAEVARLLALGARRTDVGQGDEPWVVPADPEGNEFYVFGPRRDRVRGEPSRLPGTRGPGGIIDCMSDTPRRDEDPNRPRPEPILFYATTWVDHSGGYALRRLALGLGALLLAAGGALVLRLAYQGLNVAQVGDWVRTMAVVAFAVCSSVAFTRTLSRYRHRPESVDEARERSMRSIIAVGFLGLLLAYALRSLVEAPGEKLLRAEHEQALKRYRRGRTTRTGNPARRRRKR